MKTTCIRLDYTFAEGIDSPDEVHKLTAPVELKERLAETIRRNLNQEIENEKPNYFNIFMIFVGIFLFIATLTSRYLTYYQKLFLIVCVLISIVFRTFMIMSTLPLKNRLVPIFISKVRMNTEEVVSVSEVKEPRAQMVTTRGKTRLKQEEVLVAFEFKLNRKALRHYRRKKDAREKTLLVTEPVENL